MTHERGVVEVSLRGDTRDPYPALDLCCIPESDAVVQSLVLTVQAALDEDGLLAVREGQLIHASAGSRGLGSTARASLVATGWPGSSAT